MNVAKVACRYGVAEEEDDLIEVVGVWTFHVKKPDSATAWSPGDCEILAQRVQMWWSNTTPPEGLFVAPLRFIYPHLFKLLDITVTPILPAADDPFVLTLTTDSKGQNAGVLMHAPQVATIIGLRTSADTRQGRGRIYLPAVLDDSFVQTGLVEESARDGLAKLAALLFARIAGDDEETEIWRLCVYSRTTGIARTVLSFDIPSRLATQRRRGVTPVGHFGYDLAGEPAD